tara:strand:+ start:4163 stop:5701 length:1539 start_codon:yes stop_codon:yes gene_type:complete
MADDKSKKELIEAERAMRAEASKAAQNELKVRAEAMKAERAEAETERVRLLKLKLKENQQASQAKKDAVIEQRDVMIDAAKQFGSVLKLTATLQKETAAATKAERSKSETGTARLEKQDSEMVAYLQRKAEQDKGLDKITHGFLAETLGFEKRADAKAAKRADAEKAEAQRLALRIDALIDAGLSEEQAGVRAQEEERENRSFMDKLNNSMLKVGDNIKDTAKEKGASMFTTLMTGLGLIMAVLDPAALINFVTGIFTRIMNLFTDLKDWWEGDGGAFGIFEVLYDNFAIVAAIVTGAIVWVVGIGTAVGGLVTAVTAIASVLGTVGSFLLGAASLITLPIAAAILAVAAIVAAFWKMANIQEEMGLDSIWDAFPVMVASVKDMFGKIVNGIIGFVNGMLDMIPGVTYQIDYEMDTGHEAAAKQELIDSGKAKVLADGSPNPKYEELQKAKIATASQAGSMTPAGGVAVGLPPIVSSSQVNNAGASTVQSNVFHSEPSNTAMMGLPPELQNH